jgi:endonuclease YncB( thermonuclease family)
MPYTLLAGAFVIRYPDLPRQGPQPDGDTVKFAPDTPALVDALPRPSGGAPDLNARGISVRLEAIDALETHFEGAHQELDGANAARDALLAALGFTGVTYFAELPNTVESADQDSVRGHVLSNGIDANGRLIGFVEPGEAAEPDGAQVFLDETRARGTVNAALLADGLVYAALYSTLPASLRAEFAQTARQARSAGLGLWPRATADPNGPATIAGRAVLEQLVLWPKLFRRLVPYLETGATSFDGFGAWLQEDPVNRDDAISLGRLHDVVAAAGDQVQLTAWPEDFVITPDPPA